MNPVPVNYFEIISDNATSLADFYQSILGWSASTGNPAYVSVDTGELGIRGAVIEASTAVFPKGLTLTLAVPDTGAVLDKAVAHGGAVIVPRTEVAGFGTFAMFSDPAGNRVGLMEQRA